MTSSSPVMKSKASWLSFFTSILLRQAAQSSPIGHGRIRPPWVFDMRANWRGASDKACYDSNDARSLPIFRDGFFGYLLFTCIQINDPNHNDTCSPEGLITEPISWIFPQISIFPWCYHHDRVFPDFYNWRFFKQRLFHGQKQPQDANLFEGLNSEVAPQKPLFDCGGQNAV
jgi:hypothetical protein